MDFFVNPMKRKQETPPVVNTQEAGGFKRVKKMAAKVSEAARQIHEANQLAESIRKNWNVSSPPDLAEQIIELEDRVAELKGDSSEVKKIKEVADHFHVQFVFPVISELDLEPGHGLFSFAREIHKAAKKIFQTQSMQPFYRLNAVQQYETLRYAKGGAS